jgi:hypothetical protein
MPKAAKKITPNLTRCPALDMAKLIGMNYEMHERFNDLEKDQRRSKDFKECVPFERAALAAFRTAELGMISLALTPAISFEGAVAKIIAAQYALEEELDEAEPNEYRQKQARFRARLLMQDAMNFFEKSYGIMPEKIGMADYYNRHLDPQTVIAMALEGEERKAEKGRQAT